MADFGVSEVAIAASIAAAATTAYASYASGQAQQDAASYNAKVAEAQAQQARDAAKVDAENQDLAASRVQATTRARIAASGVEMSEGSPLLTLMDNAYHASLEHQRILYGGEIRASGLQANAALSRFQGTTAATAGGVGAGINLLSGIGGAAGQYAKSRTGAGSALLNAGGYPTAGASS